VWRRTAEAAEADAAAWKAEANRIREERDDLAEDHEAQRYAAQTAARQFTDADGELAAARTRITQLTDELVACREHTAANQQADRSDWRGRCQRAEKRADRLQRELDAALGLEKGVPVDSAPWQPGFKTPKPDTKGAAS
jgi:chromosome segregation ATPase